LSIFVNGVVQPATAAIEVSLAVSVSMAAR
jgi:hypothetical protein